MTPRELIRDNITDLEIIRYQMEAKGEIEPGTDLYFIIARSDSELFKLLDDAQPNEDREKVVVCDTWQDGDNDDAFNATEANTVVDVFTADARYRAAFHSSGESWLQQWQRSGGRWFHQNALETH